MDSVDAKDLETLASRMDRFAFHGEKYFPLADVIEALRGDPELAGRLLGHSVGAVELGQQLDEKMQRFLDAHGAS